MRVRLLKLIQDIRGSYWFVPSIMVLLAIILAFVTDRLDSHFNTDFLTSIPLFYHSGPEGTRAVLSTIATAMIGVAGVTFSMTLVSVSFAASNIGPRLIGNFMRDTGNQVTLGTFISTFVYCLLILRTVTGTSDDISTAHIPNISLLVALGMSLLSVGNLIYFIHHIPESINVARIANLVGNDLQAAITELFPDDIGKEKDSNAAAKRQLGAKYRVESKAIAAPATGYIQVVDDEALLSAAQAHDLIIRIEYRPGDFVATNSILLYAHPTARVDDAVADQLTSCFVFGVKRTATQNAMFLIDQLVEIMMRALSPGVNDPFTAVGCFDWLQPVLMTIVSREMPEPCRYDEDGNLRVAVHPVSVERFASAVFDQPLQYVASDRIAALRMMQLLAELIAICKKPEHTRLFLAHALKLSEAGQQCLPVVSDQETLATRYRQTLRLAEDPAYRLSLRDTDGWLGGRG